MKQVSHRCRTPNIVMYCISLYVFEKKYWTQMQDITDIKTFMYFISVISVDVDSHKG